MFLGNLGCYWNGGPHTLMVSRRPPGRSEALMRSRRVQGPGRPAKRVDAVGAIDEAAVPGSGAAPNLRCAVPGLVNDGRNASNNPPQQPVHDEAEVSRTEVRACRASPAVWLRHGEEIRCQASTTGLRTPPAG